MGIVILGSTGSVGVQTLDVCAHIKKPVTALTGGRNVALMESQARAFSPAIAAMADEASARDLAVRLRDTPVCVLSGPEGVVQAAQTQADTVVSAVTGTAGLMPTLAAIRQGRRVALANKETLVCAGTLAMREASKYKAEILPVDSEHSAVFQCLMAARRKEIHSLILTASGGPFYGKRREDLRAVTPAQALRHPNWDMGAKITIDSATLLNKGLEMIEACHLFGVSMARIQVVVHRQSFVHSMAAFCDGSVIAQLAPPDMRLPIQYALTYPDRVAGLSEPIDWSKAMQWDFAPPDEETFGCLRLAREALAMGGLSGVVLCASGEEAVRLFLEEKIGFLQIEDCIATALDRFAGGDALCLDDILDRERAAKQFVRTQAGCAL